MFDRINAKCALLFPINDEERKARRNHLARERRACRKAERLEEIRALIQKV